MFLCPSPLGLVCAYLERAGGLPASCLCLNSTPRSLPSCMPRAFAPGRAANSGSQPGINQPLMLPPHAAPTLAPSKGLGCRRATRIPACLQARAGGYRLEAQGFAISFRSLTGLDQEQESTGACGKTGRRGLGAMVKRETFPPVTMGHIRGHGCRDSPPTSGPTSRDFGSPGRLIVELNPITPSNYDNDGRKAPRMMRWCDSVMSARRNDIHHQDLERRETR